MTWPSLGMNPLGPTLRAERLKWTRQFHRSEEEGEVTVEFENPSTGLLRRVLAGPASQTFRGSGSNASSDRIFRFAASQSDARLVHDPVEDVGERDQPRVRWRKLWDSQRIFRETAQQADGLRTRSALTSTTRCYRTSMTQTCREAARSKLIFLSKEFFLRLLSCY